MKIYCINLERSIARRQNMQAQFERLSIPFEFINAVDGLALSDKEIATVYDKWRTRFCHGKDLSRGEIGCVLSHIEFYRRVIADNAPGFLFEDDVNLGPDVKGVLKKLSSFLAEATEPCLVQLPGLERDMPHYSYNYSSGTFVRVASAMGAYAYGVNPQCAMLLLNAFSPIKFPSDYYGHLVRYYGLNFYVYNSKTISVDMVSDSTVGADRFKVDAMVKNGIGFICYKLWRFIGKIIDGSIIMIEKERMRNHVRK